MNQEELRLIRSKGKFIKYIFTSHDLYLSPCITEWPLFGAKIYSNYCPRALFPPFQSKDKYQSIIWRQRETYCVYYPLNIFTSRKVLIFGEYHSDIP